MENMKVVSGYAPRKAVLIVVLFAILLGAGLVVCLQPARSVSLPPEKQAVQSSQGSGQLPKKNSVAPGHKNSKSIAARSAPQSSSQVNTASPKGSTSNKSANSSDSAKRTLLLNEYTKTAETGSRNECNIHARVNVDGMPIQNLAPNELGMFPRVLVKAGEKIPVAVTYSDGESDDAVLVQVLDGGGIDDGVMAKVLKLNGNKSLEFVVGMSMQDGIHRVVLMKGGDRKMLEFWVGAEPLVRGS